MPASFVFRTFLAAAVVGSTVGMSPVLAQPPGVEAQYAITVAGIPIGKGYLKVKLDGSSYRADIQAKITHFSAAYGTAVSVGSWRGGEVVPSEYVIETTGDKPNSVRMTYTLGSVKTMAVDPELEPHPDRVAVTAVHKQGVLDPVAAALMPVEHAGDPLSPQSCNRTLPVFDGRQRFDLVMTYSGSEQVKGGEEGYNGTVLRCAVRYRPLAGHRPSRFQVKYMQDNHNISVWLAPVQGARLLVPYKISIGTLVGNALLTAVKFDPSGGDPVTAQR